MKSEKAAQAAAWCRKCLGSLGKYRYVLWVLALGAVLLLLLGKKDSAARETGESADASEFSVEELERRLEQALGKIDGAGEVSLILTVRQGAQRILAQDSDYDGQREQTETVIVSAGSGRQETVELASRSPVFQGALVVCPGGDDPQVRLLLTQAVSALTGLGAARITVCKGG